MGATINITEVQTALTKDYVNKNTSVLKAAVYSDEVELDKHCKLITKVNGEYPQMHAILDRVVQGFDPTWQALGKAEFVAKVLKNYRQKVNFEIIPNDVYGSWISHLYVEGLKPKDMPITKFIMEGLMEKVVDDVDDLSQIGVRDDANASGEFGKSIDGIGTVVTKAIADATYPAFKIPLNTISAVNVLDEINKFEKGLPRKTRKKVKKIYVSENVLEMYQEAMLEKYGTTITFKDDKMSKTVLKKKDLVSLSFLPDNIIFATTDSNMVKLIDVVDNPPKVTDVQVLDYKVKIFMEFSLGYDFVMNHLLYVAVFDGSLKGFDNATLNNRYYPMENLPVTP